VKCLNTIGKIYGLIQPFTYSMEIGEQPILGGSQSCTFLPCIGQVVSRYLKNLRTPLRRLLHCI
jgi:hypothetical protein